jgi:beta-mannan synthase
MLMMAHAAWAGVRYTVVLPLLHVAVYLCAAMSLMLFVERLYMGIVVAGLWLNRRRRHRRSRKGRDAAAIVDDKRDDSDDLEAGGAEKPMVLVQIPMFNEKQVRSLTL